MQVGAGETAGPLQVGGGSQSLAMGICARLWRRLSQGLRHVSRAGPIPENLHRAVCAERGRLSGQSCAPALCCRDPPEAVSEQVNELVRELVSERLSELVRE